MIGFMVMMGIAIMICYLHIRKRREYFKQKAAEKTGASPQNVINEINAICQGAKAKITNKGVHIWSIKSWHITGSRDMLNANAGFLWVPIICYTPSWISKVVSNDSKWKIAFLHTLGHEMGHRDHEPCLRFWFPTKKTRFINHVREFRCDFYGMEFMKAEYPQYTRDQIIKAKMEETKELKRMGKDTAKGCASHPSWDLRIMLLESYESFDESVIRCIAETIGFDDQRYIERMTHKALFEY